MNPSNHVAIVTGGGSGLGEATARALAARGAKVALLDIGVDAGMHTLIRPSLYGAYHPVYNLTRLGAPATMVATVVGPICESGDVLARDRRLPETKEGDVLLIAVAGAYGAAMSSQYNSRPLPEQHLLP